MDWQSLVPEQPLWNLTDAASVSSDAILLEGIQFLSAEAVSDPAEREVNQGC